MKPMPPTIRNLQQNLPWKIPYSQEFETMKGPYTDVNHALLHIMKSVGKIAAGLEHQDHHYGDIEGDIRPQVADLVICALRIANTLEGSFDLQDAVKDRLESRNKIRLAFPHSEGYHYKHKCQCLPGKQK